MLGARPQARRPAVVLRVPPHASRKASVGSSLRSGHRAHNAVAHPGRADHCARARRSAPPSGSGRSRAARCCRRCCPPAAPGREEPQQECAAHLSRPLYQRLA